MTETQEAQGRPEVEGVDGSKPSKSALRWAARYAKETGKTVHAIIAWERPIMFAGELPAGLDEDFAADARAMLISAVGETLGPTPAVKIRSSTFEGHAAAVLVREARGADILAVGNRGLSPIIELMLGSVSLHCVTHAPCPVTVVRKSPE